MALFLPFFFALLTLVGIVWLLLLPLEDYSRETYFSENGLGLPGGVNTYFSGSEQNVFRAYRSDIGDLHARNGTNEEWVQLVSDIFGGQGLKTGAQKYEYSVAGDVYKGKNVYAVLEAPRGDVTEAIVLCAAWLNIDGQLNESGVALVLALTRYFKRWSLWSKNVIFLITADSRAGPQAWVDAYHELHDPDTIASLPVKSGVIQGVVALDYPTRNNWETLHIVYDGLMVNTIAAIGHWISTGLSNSVPKKRSVSRSREGKPRARSISPSPALGERPAENTRELQPISVVLLLHLLGTIPLYLFNTVPRSAATQLFYTWAVVTFLLLLLLALLIPPKHHQLITTFSFLLLGLFLSALVTINFSISFLVGVACAPFAVVDRWKGLWRGWALVLLALVMPNMGLLAIAKYWGEALETVLEEAAFGWNVQGIWTQVVV